MQDQRGGAVAVLVPRPVTADGSELARPSGDRELAWLRHEAPAQPTSHAIRLTFDSDYATVRPGPKGGSGSPSASPWSCSCCRSSSRSIEEMLKPTAGTSVLR